MKSDKWWRPAHADRVVATIPTEVALQIPEWGVLSDLSSDAVVEALLFLWEPTVQPKPVPVETSKEEIYHLRPLARIKLTRLRDAFSLSIGLTIYHAFMDVVGLIDVQPPRVLEHKRHMLHDAGSWRVMPPTPFANMLKPSRFDEAAQDPPGESPAKASEPSEKKSGES